MTRLSNSQIDEYLGFAHRLADAAAPITLEHFRTKLDVANKLEAGFDPVTLADKSAESAISALIESTYPEHGVYGEEHGKRASANGLTWVIDPIDGTRSFITGSPLWGTLIALSGEKGPLIGMLDQPFIGERFFGVLNGGRRESFYRRGGKTMVLKTRACAGLAEAALSTTTPEMFASPDKARSFSALQSRVRLQRYGGDCYQYAQIAMGFLDLVVEAGLKPYDIHALIPIIEGAGGVVTAWDGGSANDGGDVVAAGDARTHEAALKVIQSSLS
ncbi:MAG: histidinol-phosphatase [Alphaproteobacteria bacterium]